MARPALRVRIIPKFPARIQGADGVSVTRTGGVVTIRQDWTDIQDEPDGFDPTGFTALLQNDGGEFVKAGLGPGATAAIASQAESEAGTNNTKLQTPLRTKQSIDVNAPLAISADGVELQAQDATNGAVDVDAQGLIRGYWVLSNRELEPEQVAGAGWRTLGNTNAITSGNGTDATTAIQAWVDALASSGKKGIATRNYRLTAPIITPATGPITIVSSIPRPHTYDFAASIPDPLEAAAANLRRGGWFFLDHSGVGWRLGNDTRQREGDFLQINTCRAQPAPPASGATTPWAPTAFDFDITTINSRAVVDVWCLNATKGVWAISGGYGRLHVDLHGQCFDIGLQATNMRDLITSDNICLWKGWSNHLSVKEYMKDNLEVIRIGGVDGSQFSKIFAISQNITIHIVDDPFSPGAGSALHSFGQVYSDGYKTAALKIDNDVSLFTGTILNLDSQQYGNPATEAASMAGYAIDDEGIDTRLTVMQSRFGNCGDGAVRNVDAVSSQITLHSPRVDGFNINGAGSKCFASDTPNIINIVGPVVEVTPSTVSDLITTSAVRLYDRASIIDESLGTTGWRRYSDGVLEQWGVASGYSGDPTITFPQAFTAAPYNVTCNIKDTGSGTTVLWSIGVYNLTSTNFVAGPRFAAGGTVGAATEPFFWRAIGK